MILQSPNIPQEVTIGNYLGQRQRTINFNVVQNEEFNFPMYTYNSVTLPPGRWDYDAIVSALINEIYPYDRMSAIQNNFALDPDDPDAAEMQRWRKQAKDMAKRLLEEYK